MLEALKVHSCCFGNTFTYMLAVAVSVAISQHTTTFADMYRILNMILYFLHKYSSFSSLLSSRFGNSRNCIIIFLMHVVIWVWPNLLPRLLIWWFGWVDTNFRNTPVLTKTEATHPSTIRRIRDSRLSTLQTKFLRCWSERGCTVSFMQTRPKNSGKSLVKLLFGD